MTARFRDRCVIRCRWQQRGIEFHPAEQPATAKGDIEKIEHAPPCEATGEIFQFIELSGQITATDKRADGSSGNHLDIDIGFVQRAQNADMRPATRSSAAQRQGYPARLTLDFRFFNDFFCRRCKVVIRSLPPLPPCKHHDGYLFVSIWSISDKRLKRFASGNAQTNG